MPVQWQLPGAAGIPEPGEDHSYTVGKLLTNYEINMTCISSFDKNFHVSTKTFKFRIARVKIQDSRFKFQSFSFNTQLSIIVIVIHF